MADTFLERQHALETAWRDIAMTVFREISQVAKTPEEEKVILARIVARLAESMAIERQGELMRKELVG